MPSKKKKYNARFPSGRIKKIMQTDEEIGKVAQAVPVIISRTLELFVESLLKRAMQITSAKNAKTLTPTHMKQCILSESRFDFLKDLVKGIPDVSSIDEECSTPCGNMSPAAPLSAKGYTSFRFHQTPNSSSSRSSSIASQPPMLQTSQPKFYKEIPIGSENLDKDTTYENFIPPAYSGSTVIQHTGSHLLDNYSVAPQHPTHQVSGVDSPEGVSSGARNSFGRNVDQLNELKISNCINRQSDNTKSASERKKDADEEEEEDEMDEELAEQEVKENGYHKEYKADAIDEDYDT